MGHGGSHLYPSTGVGGGDSEQEVSLNMGDPVSKETIKTNQNKTTLETSEKAQQVRVLATEP